MTFPDYDKNFQEVPPLINRDAIILVPTETFLEWARQNPEDDPDLSLEAMQEECNIYLIPEQEVDAEKWLSKNYKPLFVEPAIELTH